MAQQPFEPLGMKVRYCEESAPFEGQPRLVNSLFGNAAAAVRLIWIKRQIDRTHVTTRAQERASHVLKVTFIDATGSQL